MTTTITTTTKLQMTSNGIIKSFTIRKRTLWNATELESNNYGNIITNSSNRYNSNNERTNARNSSKPRQHAAAIERKTHWVRPWNSHLCQTTFATNWWNYCLHSDITCRQRLWSYDLTALYKSILIIFNPQYWIPEGKILMTKQVDHSGVYYYYFSTRLLHCYVNEKTKRVQDAALWLAGCRVPTSIILCLQKRLFHDYYYYYYY